MDDTKLIIIGANGQLGKALHTKYPNAHSIDSDGLDITDAQAVSSFDWSPFETLLNAAAYTNVDAAETAEGRVGAWRVNAVGPANLARVATENKLTLLHVSTDYVFDGTRSPHTEAEFFSPLSVYGQSKAAGDVAVAETAKHYILRTSWVIGDGKNFVRTMIGLGQKGIEPTVVADQLGRLTFTEELVSAIDHLLVNQAAYGTYNVTNSGEIVSWADISREVFKLAGYTLSVFETSTDEYFADKPESAQRPLHSALDLSKLTALGYVSTDWREGLKQYMEKELQQS
jgi:dTDP-4-dehydrorhamnose reductase